MHGDMLLGKLPVTAIVTSYLSPEGLDHYAETLSSYLVTHDHYRETHVFLTGCHLAAFLSGDHRVLANHLRVRIDLATDQEEPLLRLRVLRTTRSPKAPPKMRDEPSDA